MLQVNIFGYKFHGNFFVERNHKLCRKVLLKVAESPGCVRGLVGLHLSYCTMRTMFWLKELNFYINQFCRGVCVPSGNENSLLALIFFKNLSTMAIF